MADDLSARTKVSLTLPQLAWIIGIVAAATAAYLDVRIKVAVLPELQASVTALNNRVIRLERKIDP